MPDRRYGEYEQRPRQGANNMNSSGQRRPAPVSSAGSAQARPAQRPAGSAPRQAAPQRGYAAAGAPMRNPQSRPAGTAASSGRARPAQGKPGMQPRPQGTGTSGTRPANGAAAQRKPGSYNASAGARMARGAAPAGGVQKRPVSRSGYGYSGASGSGGFRLPPVLRSVCFVLIVAMLMAASVGIAAKIRSGQPQPVIAMNTADPMNQQQTASEPTNEPAATGVPAVSATDVPVSPTNAPAEETDVPVSPTDVPASPIASAGDRSATIRAIGDVIIDKTTLDNCAIVKDEEYDFSPLFELVGGVMSDADWTMINIEASLRKHRYGYMGYPQFCTPHSILNDLKAVGVDMLTMCNNHALDNYFDGLKMGLDYADAAGLAHVGAYRTQEEHDTPEIFDIGGIKVGMLNYTQFTNGMADKSDKAATEYGMRLMSGADYEGDIADLKNAGAEFTIAIMHWGEEYIREPEDDIEAIARRLVAAGADLIIGGHPHVVQPAEYITATQADGTQNTALVIYSLGNFYSEHRHRKQPYTDNGVIFEFTLSENEQGEIEMSAPAFIPIYMWQTEGAGAYEFRAVPSGVYLNNPPAGMSGEEYSRMTESYQEIVDLVGGVIEVKAD